MIRCSLFLALSICLLPGCKVVGDLGTKCTLVKKDPSDATGKRSVPILESDIKPGRDFISFGAVECEDLTCVRESAYVRDVNAKDSDPATGYCSRPCLQTSTTGCLAADPNDDSNPLKRLSCRPLILDEATLAAIRQIDPITYKMYFGDTTSPYFCARGSSVDGGSTL